MREYFPQFCLFRLPLCMNFYLIILPNYKNTGSVTLIIKKSLKEHSGYHRTILKSVSNE